MNPQWVGMQTTGAWLVVAFTLFAFGLWVPGTVAVVMAFLSAVSLT